MMDELQRSGGTFAIAENVWVKGICVPFFVIGWKGVFLVWPIDERWTPRQAVIVMAAREQIQRELGEGDERDDLQELKETLAALDLPPEARKEVDTPERPSAPSYWAALLRRAPRSFLSWRTSRPSCG